MTATDPRFHRWMRLTDIYARLCVKALRLQQMPNARMRRVAAALAALQAGA